MLMTIAQAVWVIILVVFFLMLILNLVYSKIEKRHQKGKVFKSTKSIYREEEKKK